MSVPLCRLPLRAQNYCSLQATWIRNTLLRVLRDVTNTRLLPNGFVYQHPSISSLSVFLSAFVTSTPRDLHSRERTVEEMHNLVDKYSTGLPIHTPSTKDLPPQLDSILLTGTTGILGTALLIELFKSPGVGAIYALNRRGGKSVMERQRSGLRRLCANDDILSSTKITWVEIDTSQDSLGIPSHILKDVRHPRCTWEIRAHTLCHTALDARTSHSHHSQRSVFII